MVALAIVSFVCAGVLGAYGAALRTDATAVNRLPLSVLATERLASLDLEPGPLDQLPDSVVRGTFAAPYSTATWKVQAQRVGASEGLYDVTVRVREGGDELVLRTRRFRQAAVPQRVP